MVDEWINDVDDFADPLNNEGLDKKCENGREPTLKNHVPKWKHQPLRETNLAKEDKNQIRKHDINKQIKPSNFDSKMTQSIKLMEMQSHNNEKIWSRSKRSPPATNVQDKSNNSNEILSAKLEAPKRKLHEQYQQLENAKKQRKIHITELHDLPKQGLGNKKFHTKPGFNKYRNRSNVLPL